MTLAHSVSCKSDEQSPPRKEKLSSFHPNYERVWALEGGKPDTAVARFAVASVGL